ncbi:unnamed protein product [Arctogadus glacialis]
MDEHQLKYRPLPAPSHQPLAERSRHPAPLPSPPLGAPAASRAARAGQEESLSPAASACCLAYQDEGGGGVE